MIGISDPSVPKGFNATVSLGNDLLFRSEGLAWLGVLFIRVRELDKESFDCPNGKQRMIRCKTCGKGLNCSCSWRHKHVVWMKAFLHSMMKRTQKHYQRLAVYAAMYNALMLHHNDAVVRNATMRIIRYIYAVGDDSFLCEAIDLVQEEKNVKPCKQQGRRKASCIGQLNARTCVKSAINLHCDEEKSKSMTELKRKREVGPQQRAEELSQFLLCMESNRGLVHQMLSNEEPMTTIAGTSQEFADVSRVYHRDTNATQKVFETGACLIAGFIDGNVLDFPEVPFPPMRSPEKKSKVSSGSRGKSAAKRTAEAESRNALALAATRKEVDLRPSYDMLCCDLSNAGNGKSTISHQIMRIISKRSWVMRQGDFGYHASENQDQQPFHLFQTTKEAQGFIRPNGGGGRVVRLVDAMKDLRGGSVAERPKKVVERNTLREFARDIIYDWYKRGYLSKGTDLLLILIDSGDTLTALRIIQQQKRGSQQHNNVRLQRALASQNPDTPLEDFTNIQSLIASAKKSFLRLLVRTIINEVANEQKKDNWTPSEWFGSCAVGIVGGASTPEFVRVVKHGTEGTYEVELSHGRFFRTAEIERAIEFACLRIDDRWVPATCSSDALPMPVTKHLLAHLVVRESLPACNAFSTVGKCKSISEGEEYYCVTNSDSPFLAHVFDGDMYESLMNGRVRYIRYEQAENRAAYVFYCYQDNFAAGQLLMHEDVRHIAPRFPGEFGRPDPSRVLKLSRLAKTYFMEKILNKVKVLDKLEFSYHKGCADAALFDEHILAVQAALGGTPDNLLRRGRFIKCPTQMKRSITRDNSGRVWRETPCFCDLNVVEGCPMSGELKTIIRKRRKWHDRKKKEREARAAMSSRAST